MKYVNLIHLSLFSYEKLISCTILKMGKRSTVVVWLVTWMLWRSNKYLQSAHQQLKTLCHEALIYVNCIRVFFQFILISVMIYEIYLTKTSPSWNARCSLLSYGDYRLLGALLLFKHLVVKSVKFSLCRKNRSIVF